MNEKTKKTCAGIAAAAIAATLIGLWAFTSESALPAGIGSYAGSGSAGSAVVALTTESEVGSAGGSADASAESTSAPESQDSQYEAGAQEATAAADSAKPSTKGNATASSSSTASQTDKPSSTPKGESNTAGGTSQPSRTWVEEQGHWEPTYEDVWVEDSAAWDEYVFDYDYYAFSDGYDTASDAEALAHQKATGASYSVKDHYATVHHDATGHWESRQTGQRWVVDVPAHWE